MKRSIKTKLTLWFAGILLLVAVLALVAVYLTSRQLLIQDQQTATRVAVTEFSKKVSYENGGLKISPGAHFYERGVYRCVFDGDGQLVQGQMPDQLQGVPVDFAAGTLREQNKQGAFYLEYDNPLVFGNKTYWVKGICILNDELQTVKTTMKSAALWMALLVVLSVAGVYFLLNRAFAPVEKIRRTAEEIVEGQDLSKRIRIGNGKDELHKLANSFDNMLERLQQTLEREKQFTADASHELRTPIAVIRSECECAKVSGKTPEEYEQALDTIGRQADRMQKMVGGLLTICRMENNALQADLEETNISELLNFICDDQEEIQGQEIAMVRNIAPNIVAMADRELLARLCINLIANAYQYSKKTGTITVSLHRSGENCVLSVRDTGIGIAETELPKIWDRFYRVDTARSNDENNHVGLGLSMAKRIAQCHGGDLRVESKLGEGSNFIFTLPLE